MSTIRHILFDWGGVLGGFHYSEAKDMLCTAYSIPESTFDQELQAFYREYSTTNKESPLIKNWSTTYDIPEEKLGKILAPTPSNETFAYIHTIKNVHIHLLSNQSKMRADWIREHIDLSVFDQVFLSNEIGLRKPDTAIYQYVLKHIDAKASECLFIDDKTVNTNAAEELGIKSHQYTDLPSLQSWLGEHL